MPAASLRPLYSALLLALCVLLILPGAAAHGQTARGTDALEIDVQPEAPAPGAQTTITLSSMSLDLNQATISWSVDGSPKASGAGLRSFEFIMGPAGRSTVVSVSITLVRGSVVSRTFTFRPASVLLLWEADTYTSPLYRGQALYSPGAGIRVLAVPSVVDAGGAPVPSSELNFRWQMGGDAYADRSGFGRDALLLSGSQLRNTEEVGVTLLRRDGSRAAAAVLEIPATQPMVRFYKVDPLRGTRYERALSGDVPLIDTETIIVAEPYFISGADKRASAYTHTWRLNGVAVASDGADPSVITLRQQGGAGGSAQLEYDIRSNTLTKLLQTASGALNLLLSSGGSPGSIF